MMSKVWRVTKWCTIGLMTLLLLIIATLSFALFTNAGLNSILWGVNKALPQFESGETEGALFPSFTIQDVRFRDPELSIDLTAQSTTLAVDLNCLSSPRICVNQLAIRGLEFNMPELPPSEPETEPSQPLKRITLPIPVAVGRIVLDDINVDILGTKVGWERFSSSLSMTGSNLKVGETRLVSPLVVLPPTEPSPEPQPSETREPASAIELPEVLIPLFVNIVGIEILDFKLDQPEPVIVDRLKLVGKAGKHSVDVSTLDLAMPLVDANLKGKVTLKDGYPLDLDLGAHLKQTDFAGQKLKLNASGSVQTLKLDSEFSGLITGLLKGQVQPLEPTLPFDATISNAEASWPLSGESDYQVSIETLGAKGSLEGYELNLMASASGKEIPGITVDLEGSGDLEHIDLSQLSIDTLGGNVAGQVMANWSAPVNWQGDINLTNIQPGLQWPEARRW